MDKGAFDSASNSKEYELALENILFHARKNKIVFDALQNSGGSSSIYFYQVTENGNPTAFFGVSSRSDKMQLVLHGELFEKNTYLGLESLDAETVGSEIRKLMNKREEYVEPERLVRNFLHKLNEYYELYPSEKFRLESKGGELYVQPSFI